MRITFMVSPRLLRSALLSVLWLTASPPGVEASDQIPGESPSHPVALVGATIHTVSGADMAAATVLFEHGRITAIGVDLDLPPQTESVDLAGKHIYPGMINAETFLGLMEIGAVRASRDLVEVGDIKPNVRAEVAINADSELIPVARATGVTAALVMPLGGLISGTSALVYLDGWTWEEMVITAPVGLHVSWPSMAINRSSRAKVTADEQLEKRDGRIRSLREAFADARAYIRARKAETGEGIPDHDTDLRWRAMAPVLDKEIPVFVVANEIRQIQAALDWARTEDIRMILLAGRDAWLVAGELAERHVPVIYSVTHASRRWDAYDTSYAAPARLYEAGVTFCIATTSDPSFERNLPYEAARAVAYGLPRDEALKAVTLYPAQILGVGDRLGSIEVGKDATLVVTDGDLLEITTNVELEFIEGRAVDLTSRHTQLRDKYITKYRRMGILAD